MKRSTLPHVRLAAAVYLLVLAAPDRLAAQTYAIIELPPLSGDPYCGAFALNESGQAAGYSGDRAVIWNNGVPTSIQTIGNDGVAYALNDAGWAAGDIYPVVGNSGAFIWRGSTMDRILPPAGDFISEAYAMNNSGVVVGTGGLASFGYRWQANVFQSLGVLPGDHTARPLAINNWGQIAGTSIGAGGRRPATWLFTTAHPVDMPSGGTGSGQAWGINDVGVVVGEFNTPTGRKPFYWSTSLGAQALPLPAGTTTGLAWAVNDAGIIIGEASGQPVIWRKDSGGTYEAVLLADKLTNAAGWSNLDLYAINEAGQITGDGELNGELRGFILNPGPDGTPVVETIVASRDLPFITWSEAAVLSQPQPVYAGDGTGDLIAWQARSAPSGASFKWTAVQTAGLTHQIINGPEGADQDNWSFTDGSFDWPPGTYRVTCEITVTGLPAIALVQDQVIGWRTQDYMVVGQIKPISDYEISDARRIILKTALIVSYFSPRESFLTAGLKLTLLALPVNVNTMIWTAYQFYKYGSNTIAPDYVPLRGATIEDRYWMIQSLLNDYPDLVSLQNVLEPGDLDTLITQKSYRMYSRNQLRYLLDADGRIDVASVHSIHKESDIGPTKFARVDQELVHANVSIRGVQIDTQGNSNQSFITADKAPDSGKLFINSAHTAAWLYTAGRVGLEGRVPNYALFGKDAPFIFAKIVTAIGPDGRDTDSRVHLSVDKVWRPNETVTGNAHFNEIRIYRRSFSDPARRFVLIATGPFEIKDQLASFLQSGSDVWPGLPPAIEEN